VSVLSKWIEALLRDWDERVEQERKREADRRLGYNAPRE